LIDLRYHNQTPGLELDRRLAAAQQCRSLVAIHLNSERISADILRAAAVDATCLGLPRTPAFDVRFGPASCKFPKATPTSAQCKHDEHENRVAKSSPAARLRAC